MRSNHPFGACVFRGVCGGVVRGVRRALGSAVPVAGLSVGLAALGVFAVPASAQYMSGGDDEGSPRILDEYPPMPATDGDLSDWPETGYALSDEKYLTIRFKLHNPVTLNGAPGPIIIRIDADDNSGTGRPLARLGVDLEITFSDPTPPADGGRRYGPTVKAFGLGGVETELTPHDIGLEWAPTHASEWFEVRINRRGPLDKIMDADGIGATGRVYIQLEAMGRQVAEPSFRFMWTLLPPIAEPARSLEAELPRKPEGGLRVMSWNVLWGTPQRDPEPYARILDATRPDLILFQEWDRAEQSEAQIAAWLEANHPRPDVGRWTAERSDAWGVVVATPHPVTARGPEALYAPGTRWDFPVRYAAAAIETPLGTLAAASVHYKCCGTVGGEEDARRLVEAEAVNDELSRFAEAVGADLTILGGDFNMGGTPAVATLGYAGLDIDGSGLVSADPVVLGDEVLSTFGRADRGSTGARLDFIGYPDAALSVANAFVIDTGRLSDASLAAMGLRKGDSEASDHRPVVVDLVSVGAN